MGLRLVLLGPPGSGKGTLAELWHKRLGLAHLSTGELFRQEIKRRTALGRTVSRYVQEGRLVPDEVVVTVMTRQLTARRRRRGFVLDGFPRTRGQAEGLGTFLARVRCPLHGALYLACPTSLLVMRLAGRRVCRQCGATYHLRNMPPKRSGRCDRCGGALMVRHDDRLSTVKKRLAIDRAQATPLLAYYRARGSLVTVNGSGSSEVVFARVARLLKQRGWGSRN